MFKFRQHLAELNREARQIRAYKRRGWHKEAQAVRTRVIIRAMPVLLVLAALIYLISKLYYGLLR